MRGVLFRAGNKTSKWSLENFLNAFLLGDGDGDGQAGLASLLQYAQGRHT